MKITGKTTLVLFIVVAACSFWIPRQLKLVQARRALVENQKRLAIQRDRVGVATDALESAQQEWRTGSANHDRVAAEIGMAEQSTTKVDPEVRWTAPPPSLPAWNPDSRYVWLRKEIVPKLPIPAFSEDGALRSEVAQVLTLNEASQRTLNEKLKQLVAEYRALELAKAERIDQHLQEIADEKGERITIRVQPLPDEGARVKQEFEAAMTEALGTQRAGLLMQVGEDWFNSQFPQSGDAKTITLVRQPGGSYNFSTKCGWNSFSTGGPWSHIQNYIPPHLRPLFNELGNSK